MCMNQTMVMARCHPTCNVIGLTDVLSLNFCRIPSSLKPCFCKVACLLPDAAKCQACCLYCNTMCHHQVYSQSRRHTCMYIPYYCASMYNTMSTYACYFHMHINMSSPAHESHSAHAHKPLTVTTGVMSLLLGKQYDLCDKYQIQALIHQH